MHYSNIIAGTMNWGSWGKNFTTSEMAGLIVFCCENGISTFDHADIYGGYTTEEAFGEALKQSGVDRSSVQLISKCGIQYMVSDRNNRLKHYDYGKEYIIWSVEQSLKKLQSPYLDLLLLHRPSPLMDPLEIGDAISTLLAQEKIKAFGVSNFTPSQTDLIAQEVAVGVNQIEFSLTTNNALFNGSLDHMLLNKIKPMCWSPLGNVFKEYDDQSKRINKTLGVLCEKYKAEASQILLAWILKHPAGIIPVVGTANKSRLKLAVDALKIDLELQDWFELLVSGQGHKVP